MDNKLIENTKPGTLTVVYGADLSRMFLEESQSRPDGMSITTHVIISINSVQRVGLFEPTEASPRTEPSKQNWQVCSEICRDLKLEAVRTKSPRVLFVSTGKEDSSLRWSRAFSAHANVVKRVHANGDVTTEKDRDASHA